MIIAVNKSTVSKYSAENQQKEVIMNKYQKKPVVIEAIQYDDKPETDIELQEQFGIDPVRVSYKNPDDPILIIETLEGEMKAHVGDYIIRGVHGELYPCKPDIFNETYQKVD